MSIKRKIIFSRRSFLKISGLATVAGLMNGLISRKSAAFGVFGLMRQGGAVSSYADDAFSTYLYTGNGATQTIANGIPLDSTASWNTVRIGSDGWAYACAMDSLGNFFVAHSPSSYAHIAISKFDSTGTLQWEKKLYGTISNYSTGIVTDSSGNLYVSAFSNNGTTDIALVAKYNSLGNMQWQRQLLSGAWSNGNNVAVDVSGNVFLAGTFKVAVNYAASLVKYNSSGVLQWQRTLVDNTSSARGVATDSTGNAYIIFQGAMVATYGMRIAKYNSSGVLQWQRSFMQSYTNAGKIVIDGSDNLFISCAVDSSGSGTVYTCYLIKYNSSGTLQWQRKIGTSTGTSGGVAVDGTGNAYVAGTVNSINFVAKYNTSGTIQWQRALSGLNGVWDLSAASSTNLCVAGTATGKGGMAIKLAQDGSTMSGTSDGISLLPSYLTEAAGSASDTAASATDAAGTATDSAGTATDIMGNSTIVSTTQPAVVGKGGMVWRKGRSNTHGHLLEDTTRAAGNIIMSSYTGASYYGGSALTSFNCDGFNLGNQNEGNASGVTYVAWTFRKAAKFFEIVTYTGDGTSNRALAHLLGTAPGMIAIKATNTTGDWIIRHVSATGELYLNLTNAQAASYTLINAMSAATFTVSGVANTNAITYVAYLWGHDISTNGIIQCGSFTNDGSGNATINLGWEPQFVLTKKSDAAGSNWYVLDDMRGYGEGSVASAMTVSANLTNAETGPNGIFRKSSTGISIVADGSYNATYVYLAIRRSNKAPTLGTQIYNAIARASTGAVATITGVGFAPDMVLAHCRQNGFEGAVFDRLRGKYQDLRTNSTAIENSAARTDTLTDFLQDGVAVGADTNQLLINSTLAGASTYINYFFRRAPAVFDIVCFNGSASNFTVTHSLGVVPELIMIKRRTVSTAAWFTFSSLYSGGYGTSGNNFFIRLNTTEALTGPGSFFTSTPTSSTLYMSSANYGAGDTAVAYFFASKIGISKVGSYTGDGSSSQTINCGFTAGARFVLIKRTDSTGDWYVWDTARGITASTNNPHLSLNGTIAEVTTDESIDPQSTGFIVKQVAATSINVTSATYIFLAIA